MCIPAPLRTRSAAARRAPAFARPLSAAALLVALAALAACSKDNGPSADAPAPSAPPHDSTEDVAEPTGDEDATEAGAEVPLFDPLVTHGAELHPPVRGMTVRRGTIHLHTGYSHDACDGEVWLKDADPEDADGETILAVTGSSHLMVVDRWHQCNQDVRRAVCEVHQDFLFFTDHNNNYPSFEYPDVLLYQPEDGDELIMRDGAPAAMWMTCPDGRRVLMSAGVDTHLLAFGLERHVVEDIDERRRIYGTRTEEAVEMLRDAGALVVSGYSDEWDPDLLFALPFDGFEIYNPATNLRGNLAATGSLLADMILRPAQAPHPQLTLLPVFEENEENLWRWSRLSEIRPIFNYLGTNAHQNVFREPTFEGERIDSFRRMMSWFANYVLIDEAIEHADDRQLKEIIGAGRHYGVFEFLGIALGFDYHATRGEDLWEMGARIPLDPGAVTLHVAVPTLHGAMHEDMEPPEITARILRAHDDDWVVVAEGAESFSAEVTDPGVYRVDVRMVPHHLRGWLGSKADEYIRDVVWVYSNPIFVGVHL
ncbi:MAG: hypothetical protein EA398_04785 [Deltaproteobacteria bacterium]|nr:MAG: hypothetical protein EA398_04785 [Deltaproteobacteria bacterium]